MLVSRLASASLVAGALVATFAGAYAEPRALLELFTSQGCSSCPPADKLLGQLAKDPTLIALSLPINIWDYLGWKDTLALPGHSALQRAYARMRGDRQVYTPQIVVNGLTHALGSDHAAIDRAIVQTDRNPAVMSVPVGLFASGGDLTVTVKAVAGALTGAEVWLCPIARAIRVAIGRGENRGRTVTYYNVVRGWDRLGKWSGTAVTWHVPISNIETGAVDAAAVMVQEGTRERPGLVLGAGIIQLAHQASTTAAAAPGKVPMR
jgi:hypothetical protein